MTTSINHYYKTYMWDESKRISLGIGNYKLHIVQLTSVSNELSIKFVMSKARDWLWSHTCSLPCMSTTCITFIIWYGSHMHQSELQLLLGGWIIFYTILPFWSSAYIKCSVGDNYGCSNSYRTILRVVGL